MLRITGVIGVLSGLAAVASAFSDSPPDAHKHLAQVTQIAAANTAPAPAQRFAVPAIGSGVGVTSRPSGPTLAPAPHSNVVLTSIQPGDADARRALVREIQKELRRASCYRGAIDGVWSQQTRNGMARLVTAANARLPTTAPDYILLALAKAARTQTCGAPSTVVAQSSAAPTPVAPQQVQRPKTRRTVTVSQSTAPAVVRTRSVASTETSRRSAAVVASRAEERRARQRAAKQRAERIERERAQKRAAERQQTRAARAAALRRARARERQLARRERARRRRVASRSRRFRPTYRLRPTRRARNRYRARRASRRFNAQRFFATINDR